MIDAAILAAIEARLQRALALPARRYLRFVVGGAALGFVDEARAARLARFGVFRLGRDAVVLDERLESPAARSAALADVALALRAEGALPAWRDELYAVAREFGAPPHFLLERGAARYFGVRTWAAHVNGIVQRDGPPRIWFARRSATKAVDPGLLDNLVGGGIAAGLTVAQTVAKEAWEEAGIAAALAREAAPAGTVRVRRALRDGLQRETLFVHDLQLPEAFVPTNRDGEAVEHRLVDREAAAQMISQAAGPNEVTIDASLVVLDWLLRHRALAPGPREAAALEPLLRAPAD